MKIEAAIWNGKRTKVLAVCTFNSTKELLEFMTDLRTVEKEADYNITAVRP